MKQKQWETFLRSLKPGEAWTRCVSPQDVSTEFLTGAVTDHNKRD